MHLDECVVNLAQCLGHYDMVLDVDFGLLLMFLADFEAFASTPP